MIVTCLRLTNFRAIEAAEFRFHRGVNLIVGVNGVGKTGVLDALGVCLSAVERQVNKAEIRVKPLSADDVRVGADGLAIECRVRFADRDVNCSVRKQREARPSQKRRVRFVGRLPARANGSAFAGRPLAVLFSTRRAVPSERAPGKAVAGGGITGALADAFASRELRLGEFATWMKVQEALRGERPAGARALAACQEAVESFLPGYRNLRPDDGARPRLWIDRDGTTLPVRQLSDGERGSLALVLDLTRRLALANPELDAPASEAEAVVLIDDIDLHLHPRWQRQIVHNLTAAFPRCQFIATTHSPQVIGEVPHERIQILGRGQIYAPTHSFGVDSSRVLEEIMDATPRTAEVRELLEEISHVLDRQRFDHVRVLLGKLVERLGEADPEVTRLQTLLEFMEGGE